ncbi:MAG: hypothetical protein Q8S71_03890 [Hydrogenophaga sp.]|nr:hypothetical protein [Hydrogenophaga sp.]
MKLLIAFLVGYGLALIVHFRIIKRLKDTHDYVYKHHYSLKAAWFWAGRTL